LRVDLFDMPDARFDIVDMALLIGAKYLPEFLEVF
jgi:hypothetical protein